MRRYRDLLALDEPEGRWVVLVASEADIAFIESLPSDHTSPITSPAGLTVWRRSAGSQFILGLPKDWSVNTATLADEKHGDHEFPNDALVLPPDVKVESGNLPPADLELDYLFEPVRISFHLFLAVDCKRGEQHAFHIEAVPKAGEPNDVLLNWPEISADVLAERTKLEQRISERRLEYPKIGSVHDWRPPDYSLAVADTKGRICENRTQFAAAFSVVEEACIAAATKASLDGCPSASGGLMQALDALRVTAINRERLAHRLGKYGQLSRLIDHEWKRFGQARGRRKADRSEEKAKIAARKSKVLRAARELLAEIPTEKISAPRICNRLVRSTNWNHSSKTIQNYLRELIAAGELPVDRFRVKPDTKSKKPES